MSLDKKIQALLSVVILMLLGGIFVGMAKADNADFYECEPNSTLVVCAVGERPNVKECRNVGSGTTTLAYGDCS